MIPIAVTVFHERLTVGRRIADQYRGGRKKSWKIVFAAVTEMVGPVP